MIRPLDTSTLGPIRVGPTTPKQRAILAVMRELGCRDAAGCTVEPCCVRLVELVLGETTDDNP